MSQLVCIASVAGVNGGGGGGFPSPSIRSLSPPPLPNAWLCLYNKTYRCKKGGERGGVECSGSEHQILFLYDIAGVIPHDTA